MTDTTSQTERQARCSCGQLALTVTGEPVRVSICHCRACQRRTGSAFGVQARFDRDQVAVAGRSKMYLRTADSGNPVSFHFCPDCGSTVFYSLDQLPDVIAIPVGAFADQTFPGPGVSVYEARQHAWVRVPEEITHYD
mgnify:FL=1